MRLSGWSKTTWPGIISHAVTDIDPHGDGDDAAREAHILASWRRNADAWTRAVREQRIESRRRVTDTAIVDAVLARQPGSVIDLGCGEGWLARRLTVAGVDVLGVDAVEPLVARAEVAGGGRFRCMTYEAISSGHLRAQADVVVCNFSLIGGGGVEQLVAAAPGLLHPGGAFVVQTLHPLTAGGNAPYRDGWRAGSWRGFDDAFEDPAPWYFRTVGSWLALLDACGLRVAQMHEPLHPVSAQPVSLLLVAVAAP